MDTLKWKPFFEHQDQQPLDLAPYIEHLLYQHDCVILPTIGGFIVNYGSATLDVVEQQVAPPHKTVSFNAKLVTNDGLLAHHIAQKEHLTYKQAATRLEAYTRDIELALLDKKVVHFPTIGKLYFNGDSRLEFLPEATNFLRDAYGLPTFSCMPILRSKDYLQQTTAPVVTRRSKVVTLWSPARIAAAAVVLLLLFSAPYWYSKFWNSNTTTQTTIAQDRNQEVTQKKEPSTTSITASVLPALSTSTQIMPLDTTALEESPVQDPAPLPKVDSEPTNDYIIVLGAFGKEPNAQRLAKRLANDNYLPDVTLKNGLHRVGVQINCTQEDLQQHLTFLQDHYNKKAWIVE